MAPEAYAEFIRQMHLRNIWLHEARVVNHFGPETPPRGGSVRMNSDARWEPRVAGFRVLHHSVVHLEHDDAPLAEAEVTFGLDFDSEQPMTEPIFALFRDINLPVNTWPYVREYLASTMGRMTWVPFTLPALKRGTGQTGGPNPKSAPASSPNRVRRTKAG